MSQSQILIVDDDAQLREAIADTLVLSGYACIEAGGGQEALGLLSRRRVDLVVSDIQMDGMDGHTLLNSIHEKYPQLPVLLMTAYANIDGAVRAMRDGAIDYLAKPFAPEVLLNQVSRYVPVNRIPSGDPVWRDPSTGELLKLAARVAQSEATVMITGPSGSGKEILSRYVHDKSPRAAGPFVAINCAAIPDTMLEATLFGYEKGAYTGAVQACPGKFEQAQGGTILLDEITEMDLKLQSKLLRVLQEKEVERLGARKTISLDVRVIATSNRDLRQAVSEGRFREDLYYRLNVFPLRWRPLRERRLDIVPIAEFLLAKHAAGTSQALPELTAAAKARLEGYDWPGNVRELDNVMQRCLILASGGKIDAQAVIFDVEQTPLTPSGPDAVPGPQVLPMIEREGQAAGQGERPGERLGEKPGESQDAGGISDARDAREDVPSAFDDEPPEAVSGVDDEAVRRQTVPAEAGGGLKQQELQIILDTLIECHGNRQMVSDKLGISPRTLRYKIAKMREMGMIIPG